MNPAVEGLPKINPLLEGWTIEGKLRFKCPLSLRQLALDAFGNYISSVLIRLSASTLDLEERDLNNQDTETIERLENVIQQKVPLALVNEMSITLLKKVEVSYISLLSSHTYKSDVFLKILSAVLHPSATRIECYQDFFHPCKNDTLLFRLSSMIIHSVHKLKSLKVLRLINWVFDTPSWVGDGVILTENLEEFSSNVCNNKLLDAISKTCKNLRVLSVANSIAVTDVSVAYMKRFKCLEYLNICKTDITSRGLWNILNNLSEMEVAPNLGSMARPQGLKALTCTVMNVPHISFLVNHLPNICSLSFSAYSGVNLSILKPLKLLSELTLVNCFFHGAEELLPKIGNQLKCLRLEFVEVDLFLIAKFCISLECFSIYSNTLENFVNFGTKKMISVQCLHICANIKFSEYLMSLCPNVKKLYVVNGQPSIFKKLINREFLEDLEYMYWNSQVYNLKAAEVEFFDKCVVLTNVNFQNGERSISCTPLQ